MVANTLAATDYKDPPTVSEEPTDEDMAFWREVF